MEAVSKRSLFKEASIVKYNTSLDTSSNNANTNADESISNSKQEPQQAKSSMPNTNQNDTILFEKSMLAEGTSVPNQGQPDVEVASTRPILNTNSGPLTDQNFIEPTLVLDSSETESNTNHQAEQISTATKKRPEVVNHSFFFNSLNESTSNIRSAEKYNKVPPNANDILGTSYMGENSLSTTNYTMHSNSMRNDVTINQQQQHQSKDVINKSHENVIVARQETNEASEDTAPTTTTKTATTATDSGEFKVPSNPISSKNDSEETQFTDSELYRIDNLCQDMYEGHNKTLAGDELNDEVTDARKSALKSAHSVGAVATHKRNKMEFVCSLLKPDIKVNLYYINYSAVKA